MDAIIKVGFCVAYDWEMLKKSLPLVYDHADQICLSLDKDRKSWSGIRYDFDEQQFHTFLKKVDRQGKIDLYEDSFYVSGLTPIENDSRQRELMSKRMGDGGWHIQVDSDEYFLNFKDFTDYLRSRTYSLKGKPVNICCQWISVFKRTPHGYLIVDNSHATWESMPFATNRPEYLNARRNSHFNIISPFFIVHETWSRSREELIQKVNSWGHDSDFIDKNGYINFWLGVDDFNYKYIYDFHPLKREVWNKLAYIKADSIEELVREVAKSTFVKISRATLFFRNSRNWNRIISLMSEIGLVSKK